MPKFNKGYGLPVLLGFLAYFVLPGTVLGATVAQCNTGLSLTETTPLSFGGIMDTGLGGGTVTVDTADLATYSSTMAWGAEIPTTGKLDINVTQTGNCNHTQSISVIQLTPLTLVGDATQTMNMSAFTTAPANLDTFSRSKVVLNVGATLTINDGQKAGTYNGQYSVTYVFQ